MLSKACLRRTSQLSSSSLNQKCTASLATVAKMPDTDFVPRKYTGPSHADVKATRDKHLSKGVLTYYKDHVLVNQAHKQWIFDHNNKRYLDLFAGIVTVSVGHCHPKVNAALEEQIQHLWHTTSIYMYPGIHEYTQKLLSKFPKDSKLDTVLYVNSGSEANDLAQYMARAFTGNWEILGLRNAYHGMSPYAMGLTALNNWRFNVPTGFGVQHSMNADPYRGVWGGKQCRDGPIQIKDRACDCVGECQAGIHYADQVQDVLNHSMPKGGKLAAFFAESIQGVGGTVQFPTNFLQRAAKSVRASGGLVVSDEVQTGFGRTGSNYWGFQNNGITPDIVTMAKGIANGFPMAAVVTSKEIADVMGQALYFNTFGGNPMACAVAGATMDVIDEEKLMENSATVGTHFLNGLAELREEFEMVGDVRGKGLMIGMEMVEDKATKKPLSPERMNNIFEKTREKGVLVGKGGLYGNVFRIKPPMCVTKEDVEFAVQVFRECIHEETSKSK